MNHLIFTKESQTDEFIDEFASKIAERLKPDKGDSLSEITVGELFEYYLDNYAKIHCKSWRNMERMFNSNFGCWKNREISKIKRYEIQEWHADLQRRISPTTANRAAELLCMIYNKAVEWEFVGKNPAAKIRKFRLDPRERFLQETEIPRFFAALNTLRYETTRDFILMCLFTAVRRSNVAAMRWDEISLERQIWHIPHTKNGTSQIQPLMPEALAILSKRKTQTNSEWVFPSSRSKSGHLTKPESAWAEVIKRAGLNDLHLHDLRRTLASYQALEGVDVLAIAKTLNHKDLKSTLIYARLNVEGTKTAMVAARNKILHAAGIEPGEVENANKADHGLKQLVPSIEKEWVDTKEAAKIIGVRPGVLEQWRWLNTGPQYLKNGYSIKYHTLSLLAWKERDIPEKTRYPVYSSLAPEVIKHISLMKTQGLSFDDIAKELNRKGLLNRGKPWRKSAVWNIYSKHGSFL